VIGSLDHEHAVAHRDLGKLQRANRRRRKAGVAQLVQQPLLADQKAFTLKGGAKGGKAPRTLAGKRIGK
jgi:hypothetical protein